MKFLPTSDAERGAYLGVPTLAIAAWFAFRGRRTGGEVRPGIGNRGDAHGRYIGRAGSED